MRVVLADLAGRSGFVTKDTVSGGYGSRFRPFSRTTAWVHRFKRQYHDTPSVHLAYLAAILAERGHEVVSTNEDLLDGDVAIVLSSLVDYRHEIEWADQMRARGVRVGFVGLAASKLPELFADHADFVVDGEPEAAVARMAAGETLQGPCPSEPIEDLDSLPFPRWDLVAKKRPRGFRFSVRPVGGGFPVLASRGCPEFCTYCPHRILASYRTRSVANVVDEIARLCDRMRQPYVIFRDALFSERRDRILELCDEIEARDLKLHFECETRLDRMDEDLLRRLYSVGLRGMSFGVESVSPAALRKVGRRPVPAEHQRQILRRCRELGIVTCGFFVLGFLTDDWASIAATIEFSTDLAPTFAQFKLLTPFPGTPLYRQLQPLIFETDWEKFDGLTPTFRHPNLTSRELMFLLGAGYAHFYVRPTYLANLLRIDHDGLRGWLERLDHVASARLRASESRIMSRPVAC